MRFPQDTPESHQFPQYYGIYVLTYCPFDNEYEVLWAEKHRLFKTYEAARQFIVDNTFGEIK